jgi:hypothetical protein
MSSVAMFVTGYWNFASSSQSSQAVTPYFIDPKQAGMRL